MSDYKYKIVPFWFTQNDALVSSQKIKKHLEDTFVDITAQLFIWNIIINNARAGYSLRGMIDLYSNDNNDHNDSNGSIDDTLVEYLQELIDDGYECHGGINLYI